MTDPELATWAAGLLWDHNPVNQDHNYQRCELCGFVRHPCDVHELAGTVLHLLDRKGSDGR